MQKGLYPNVDTPKEVKDQVWKMIEERGFESLYQEIEKKDPDYAKIISPNDHYRIRRSLEILLSQKMTLSQLKTQMENQTNSPLPKNRSLKLGLLQERKILRERVLERSRLMLERGLIEEVRSLRDRGWVDWAPLRSVGYKEVGDYLDGNIAKSDLIEKITTSTMQLIKKQTTWFKRDKEIHWFDRDDREKAKEFARQWFYSKP